MRLTVNIRDFIHRNDYSREEFVSDGLHVFDRGLQSCPDLLMGHGLLWCNIVGQFTVGRGETMRRMKK